MKRASWLFGVLTCASLTGCVERRFVIEAVSAADGTPVSAQVLRNGQSVGFAPVDDSFVYYGKYHLQLIKDGYETLNVDQEIPAPWYEYPPLDFVNEVLNPFQLRDVREFNYQMQKIEQPSKEDVLRRGQELRQRGQVLVGQQPPPPPAPAAPVLGAPLP